MKKRVFIHTLILTFLLSVGSAYAEEKVNPISEMPVDTGIVIDVSGDKAATTNNAPSGGEIDINALVTQQAEEEAAANDGTVLPLDNGQVDGAEVDTGTVSPQPKPDPAEQVITTPADDTVVLTEEEPKVEPLAQTGLASSGLTVAGVGLMIGLASLILTRRVKVDM